MADPPLLNVTDLKTHFETKRGIIKAVDGVSFDLSAGETVALVGESGSGKSVTGLSILDLVPSPPGQIVSGRVELNGVNLLTLSKSEFRSVRGRSIAMVFQEPMTSLNPVMRVEDQIGEVLRIHGSSAPTDVRLRIIELLNQVGIPDPESRMRNYPHQMSGGMRQRVMIAIALAGNPRVLIADEPTTALDVTIQVQILNLLRKIQKETDMGILFITHDLGVVAEIADRVLVMYAGRIVEAGPVDEIFSVPRMPYTYGLLQSVPRIDTDASGQNRLYTIPGSVPHPLNLPTGCAFAPRCTFEVPECNTRVPELEMPGEGRAVRCIRHHELNLLPVGPL